MYTGYSGPRRVPRTLTLTLTLTAVAAFSFLPALLDGAGPEDRDRLDDGIGDGERHLPVFVRMQDQFLQGAGDYEAFSRKNRRARRADLRKEVLESLRQKADRSWKKIEKQLSRLEKQGAIRNLARYWIVNGFACQATGKACQELARHDAVSFIYRQRRPGPPLHRNPSRARASRIEWKQVYESVLAEWRDDSDEPLSTEGCKIPWNVERVRADQAWEEEKATGKGVVVALLDSGLLVTPSLVRALWRNPGEKLNGEDDDGNGHVDDLFGYDFLVDSWYALDDGPTLTHGSMCAGIVAGRPLNREKMITGIAPRARLMVLRGMGHLRAYEYALANGADVVSMSYMWPGVPLGNYRGLYRLAHEHLAAGGIVAVGGAGNFGPGAGRARQPRGKQIALPKDIPCVIAAAGILKDGRKAPAGSEGPCTWNGVKFYDDYPPERPLLKPDVTGCFGGYPVWGRPQMAARLRAWQVVSRESAAAGLIVGPAGNSFSGPHAAGVAALMLSANPQLNPWEVKQLMEETCKDLGEEGRDTVFGAGLLDALSAVRAARAVKKK